MKLDMEQTRQKSDVRFRAPDKIGYQIRKHQKLVSNAIFQFATKQCRLAKKKQKPIKFHGTTNSNRPSIPSIHPSIHSHTTDHIMWGFNYLTPGYDRLKFLWNPWNSSERRSQVAIFHVSLFKDTKSSNWELLLKNLPMISPFLVPLLLTCYMHR